MLLFATAFAPVGGALTDEARTLFPPSADEGDVAFDHEADLQAGRFAEDLDAGGGNTVWAQVCHGGICGVASTGIE